MTPEAFADLATDRFLRFLKEDFDPRRHKSLAKLYPSALDIMAWAEDILERMLKNSPALDKYDRATVTAVARALNAQNPRRAMIEGLSEELQAAHRVLSELHPSPMRWKESIALRHLENAIAQVKHWR